MFMNILCIEIVGNCTCDQGYGGSDCSFDTLSAPEIWSTFPSNICDKSTQSCSRIHFTGRYFIANIRKTCYIQRTLVCTTLIKKVEIFVVILFKLQTFRFK